MIGEGVGERIPGRASEQGGREQLSDSLGEDWGKQFLREIFEACKEAPVKWPTSTEIGDEMEDGTIYAGVSPDTGRPMYAMPADAPTTFTFKKAAKYAKKLDAHGHKDWRVPTKNELNVLYENRNEGKLKGTFNETGSNPAGWYWSSSQALTNYAWVQCLSDGYQHGGGRCGDSSLRLVR